MGGWSGRLASQNHYANYTIKQVPHRLCSQPHLSTVRLFDAFGDFERPASACCAPGADAGAAQARPAHQSPGSASLPGSRMSKAPPPRQVQYQPARSDATSHLPVTVGPSQPGRSLPNRALSPSRDEYRSPRSILLQRRRR